jgi:hypothetical protein
MLKYKVLSSNWYQLSKNNHERIVSGIVKLRFFFLVSKVAIVLAMSLFSLNNEIGIGLKSSP